MLPAGLAFLGTNGPVWHINTISGQGTRVASTYVECPVQENFLR